MTDIKWQNPPKRKGGAPGKWALLAPSLRQRPHQWALIGHQNSAANVTIKKGLGAGFQVSLRRTDEGFDIYARYIGGES